MKKIKENIETFENSEHFEDKELDQLICDTFEREDLVKEINMQVMKEVKALEASKCRQTSPLALWRGVRGEASSVRSVIRPLAFAFGLPFVLVCFAFGIRYLVETFANQPYSYISAILSSAAMLLFATQTLKKFSLQE